MPAAPLLTATPETLASPPGRVQPAEVIVAGSDVVPCGSWQSVHWLCRSSRPANSLSVSSVWPVASAVSWDQYDLVAGSFAGWPRVYWACTSAPPTPPAWHV